MKKLSVFRKAIAKLLVFAILITSIPLTEAFATESNTTGDCYWRISNQTLYISGNGKMADYSDLEVNQSFAPWWGKDFNKIVIEEGVTYIGEYAFDYSRNFTELTSVTIPKSVTKIGAGAFRYCELEEIILHDDITELGYGAFEHNNIKTIDLPSKITKIAGCLFDSCYYLEEIELHNNIQSIGAYAFCSCRSLKPVVFPESVKTIGASAFRNCHSFDEITIPGTVETIGGYAFSGSTLNKVNIENGVKYIENYAFYDCNRFTDITLPGSVIEIGNYVFAECSRLERVVLSEGITSLGGYGVFQNCEALTDVTLPSTLTTIGDDVFRWCTALEKILLPDSVLEVGSSLFGGCTALTDVSLPSNLKSIPSGMFDDCTALEELYIPNGITSIGSAFNGCTSLKKISIPETVTGLGQVFSGCTSLEEVVLHEGLLSIGNHAFNGCASLKSINIPSTVTEIGSYVFFGCESLTEIELPKNLTGISHNLFSGCSSLKTVNIPENVTIIHDAAFKNCTSLADINLPVKLIMIGKLAFSNCTSLTSVSIPKGNVSVDQQAFLNCTGLTEVTFGENMSFYTPAANIFEGCTNLQTVNYLGTEEEFLSDGCDTLNISNVVYLETCPNNNHQYAHTCDEECNICDYVRQLKGHIYDNACDTVCNGCGYINDIVVEHIYDDEIDANCNECGYLKYLHGDVNSDKQANLSDVVLLAQRVAGWDVLCDETAIDTNSDGLTNLNDVVLLAQYVAGWKVDIYYGKILKKGTEEAPEQPTVEVIEHTFLNTSRTENGITFDTIICSDCGLEVLSHGYADGSMNGSTSKVKYYVEGSPIDEDNLHLVIYGEGSMVNYSTDNRPLWDDYIHKLKKITIKNGVTNIGRYAFYGSDNSDVEFEIGDSVKTISSYGIYLPVKNISLGSGVERVELCALHGNIENVYIPDTVKFVADIASRRHTYFYGGSKENLLKVQTSHDGSLYTVDEWITKFLEIFGSEEQPFYAYLEASDQFDKHLFFDILKDKGLK